MSPTFSAGTYISNSRQPAHDQSLNTMTPSHEIHTDPNSGHVRSPTPPPQQHGRDSHSTIFGHNKHPHDGDFPTTTIVLSPVANPQALGLAAWASATFIFSAYLAEWYGTTGTGATLWPFILAFGGLGQFAAGMWSFRARDTLSSVIHTMWGSYWLALGIFFASSAYNNTVGNPISIWSRIDAFAIWQVPIAAFTWAACIASLFRDWNLMAILFTMATGSTLSVVGWFTTSETVLKIAAYFWIASSVGMWYRVAAHFIAETTHKENILPIYSRPRGPACNSYNQEGCRRQWVAPYREAGVVQGEW